MSDPTFETGMRVRREVLGDERGPPRVAGQTHDETRRQCVRCFSTTAEHERFL